MEDDTKQKDGIFPSPPAYYKKFEKSPSDLKKPNLKLLQGKGYSLKFNNMLIPVNYINYQILA